MKVWLAILLAVFPVSQLLPQDAETMIVQGNERKFTILSEIEDRTEVAAFLSLVDAKTPEKRYLLATNFLSQYPKSWLLSQVSDLLSRSCVDLNKYPEALSSARFSLRLMPENPSLRILLANLEAQNGENESATRDAKYALELLDQMEQPRDTTEKQWNLLHHQLKSSAHFAIARTLASQGLRTNEPAILQKSLAELNQAAAWNAEDAEVFYLRALVQIRLQQKAAAASDLAFVWKNSPALRERATTVLSILLRETSSKGETLEQFIQRLPSPNVDAALIHGAKHEEQPKSLAGGYAGPHACANCHARQYDAWQKTGMARMLQPFDSANVFGDFSATYTEPSTTPGVMNVIRLGVDKKPFFEFQSGAGWTRYPVDFTIGSKWQQAYATKLPDGSLQVFPIEYNRLQKKWINYWKIIDPPGGVRSNIGEFPKLASATNYQRNCAICHTSQLKADPAGSAPLEHAKFLQPGVDCEMCHGPSAWHAKQMRNHSPQDAEPDQPPIHFRQLNNREGVKICAQCHRQSAVRQFGENGEINYSTRNTFLLGSTSRPYDEFSRRGFYKDGRFRETTFIAEAFTRSACYLRGAAQCASCHSPHLANFETNQTSLKFSQGQNEMCLGCHAQYRQRISQHTRHPANSEASRCVTCHMPRIVNALLFQARSHQIEVPTADLTERFGQQDSPNVCLTCHAAKGTAWVEKELAAWPH
jgi:predicted CXXCH cytochrome family protein